jgi:hypothetical protein
VWSSAPDQSDQPTIPTSAVTDPTSVPSTGSLPTLPALSFDQPKNRRGRRSAETRQQGQRRLLMIGAPVAAAALALLVLVMTGHLWNPVAALTSPGSAAADPAGVIGAATATSPGPDPVIGAAASDAGLDPATLGPGQYIDCTTGDDGSDGSGTHPWRSLAPLQRNGLVGGTTTYIKSGCSFSGQVTLSAHGTGPGAVATLASLGTGEAPVIQAPDIDRRHGALIIASPYITVVGLHVSHAAGPGIEVTAPHTTVDAVEIDDVGFGMTIRGAFTLVSNSRIHDLHMYNNTQGGNDDSGAIGFDIEADDVTVTHTSCIHCRAESYDYGHDGGFADIFDAGNRVKLISNTGDDIDGFLELGSAHGGSANDVLVKDNVITHSYGGFVVHSGDTFGITVNNLQIVGNTIINVDPGKEMFYGNLGAIVLKDNSLVSAGAISHGSGTPAQHSGNRYYVSNPGRIGWSVNSSEKVAALSAYKG